MDLIIINSRATNGQWSKKSFDKGVFLFFEQIQLLGVQVLDAPIQSLVSKKFEGFNLSS